MLFGWIALNLGWLYSKILTFEKFRTSGVPADFTVYFSLYIIFWLPVFLAIMSLLQINRDWMPIHRDICANWKCQIVSLKVILCEKGILWTIVVEKGGNNGKSGSHRYATQFEISKGSCTDRSFKKFETVSWRLPSLSSPNLLCRLFPGTLLEDRASKSGR
jgi:hypothetical protein